MEKVLLVKEKMEEIQRVLAIPEIELFKMVRKKFLSCEISEKLFISEGTVKKHLYDIYRKSGLKSWPNLICYAREKGLRNFL